MRHRASQLALAALLASVCVSASAKEYPIGKPAIKNGMEIGAVYLQPTKMEPEGMMRKAEDSDIHLEADIHAVKNNPNGFEEGAWMPYLLIKYEISKVGGKEVIKGDMMPMGLFFTAWMSASRWMSESSALRIMPSGSILVGCRYTAPISMPFLMAGLPIGYSLADALTQTEASSAARAS
jgi:hypothetical protein